MEVQFTQTTPIEKFPPEIYLEIFSDFSIHTLGKLTRISKFFNMIISTNDIVWKNSCKGRIRSEGMDWKNLAKIIHLPYTPHPCGRRYDLEKGFKLRFYYVIPI